VRVYLEVASPTSGAFAEVGSVFVVVDSKRARPVRTLETNQKNGFHLRVDTRPLSDHSPDIKQFANKVVPQFPDGIVLGEFVEAHEDRVVNG